MSLVKNSKDNQRFGENYFQTETNPYHPSSAKERIAYKWNENTIDKNPGRIENIFKMKKSNSLREIPFS